mgnify:CR=1 FL=1
MGRVTAFNLPPRMMVGLDTFNDGDTQIDHETLAERSSCDIIETETSTLIIGWSADAGYRGLRQLAFRWDFRRYAGMRCSSASLNLTGGSGVTGFFASASYPFPDMQLRSMTRTNRDGVLSVADKQTPTELTASTLYCSAAVDNDTAANGTEYVFVNDGTALLDAINAAIDGDGILDAILVLEDNVDNDLPPYGSYESYMSIKALPTYYGSPEDAPKLDVEMRSQDIIVVPPDNTAANTGTFISLCHDVTSWDNVIDASGTKELVAPTAPPTNKAVLFLYSAKTDNIPSNGFAETFASTQLFWRGDFSGLPVGREIVSAKIYIPFSHTHYDTGVHPDQTWYIAGYDWSTESTSHHRSDSQLTALTNYGEFNLSDAKESGLFPTDNPYAEPYAGEQTIIFTPMYAGLLVECNQAMLDAIALRPSSLGFVVYNKNLTDGLAAPDFINTKTLGCMGLMAETSYDDTQDRDMATQVIVELEPAGSSFFGGIF